MIPLGRNPESLEIDGWQASHQLKKIKQQVRQIAQLSEQKPAGQTSPAYGVCWNRLELRSLQKAANDAQLSLTEQSWLSERFYEPTSRVVDTAFQRTQLGETVANEDKIFSIFETHTQLYRRGKTGQPNQFGRLVIVYKTARIPQSLLFDGTKRKGCRRLIEQTKIAQRSMGVISFDRGYFSPANQTELSNQHPCLPPRHRNQYAQFQSASVRMHSSFWTAIGSFQRGNGMALPGQNRVRA